MSLEIGLVGVGPWGAHILRDLRELGASVHCVARSPDSIRRAESGGGASIVNEPALLPSSCQGYVVANRTTSHLDAIEALLPRGRPIFCEKPLSNDLERAKRLPASARNLVFIMHKWRYHPGVLELARIAREEDYGPALGLRLHRLSWGSGHPDVTPLWTLAPHDISIALTIFGEVPDLVFAAPNPLDHHRPGAIAHLRTSKGAPIAIEVSAAYPKHFRSVLLSCRDAVCQLDSEDYAKISVVRFGEKAATTIEVGNDMPLLTELRAFVGYLGGGPKPVTAFEEELKIVELITQIERDSSRV